MNWEDAVVDPEYVAHAVLPQMQDIVERAILAGAKPPLEYVGAGMTSVVLCSGKRAYKTARSERTISLGTLHDEAEWMETAGTVPWVKDRVARFHRFDSKNVVIVRECPTPGPDMTPYRYGESKLWDMHQEIGKQMIPNGWSAPEFKPDSYVITENGPLLVDASFASRVGQRLLDYTRDLIEGRREPGIREKPEGAAFDIRNEIGRTLTEEEVSEVLAELQRLESSGNRWTTGETTMMNDAATARADRPKLQPGDWIEVRDPSRRVSYGMGGVGIYKVVKVGRVNVRASVDIRFRPDGPVFHQEHIIPLHHVVRVVPTNELMEMHDGPSFKRQAAIDLSRSQKDQARAEIAAARAEAKDARNACTAARRQAIETCAGAKTLRIKRDALVKLAHEYRLIRRAELARTRKGPGVSRVERKSESDDEVLYNIPSELIPTWDRVKRDIKGTDRMSRTEAFLEWVEKHPSEIVFVEPSDEELAASWERSSRRAVGEMRENGIPESHFIDFFIFDAEDQDIGLFSRADTAEVAKFFKIKPEVAYNTLNLLAEKGLLTKTRDTMKKHRGKTAVGYQIWEYYWKPGDLERFDSHSRGHVMEEGPRDQLIDRFNGAGQFRIDRGKLFLNGNKIGDLVVTGSENYVEVNRIEIDKAHRQRGYARGAMVQLLKVTDATGVTVTLSPTNEWGASKEKLTKFYTDLGFVKNQGRTKDFSFRATMYRLPRR